jgi:hypothetical protein
MRICISILTSLLLIATLAWGTVPQTLSFQGTLRDGNGSLVPDGDYQVTFRIYDVASAGQALWEEAQEAPVSGSVLSTVLGEITPLDLPFDEPYWLGIQLGEDPELEPRVVLTASPYSLNVADGRVVKSLNTLTDDVSLVGGEDILISQVGQTITIAGTGGGMGGGEMAYPDGLADLTPVTLQIYAGHDYRVATGKNLYITNVYNPGGFELRVAGYAIMNVTGNANTKLPIIAASDQFVSSSASAGAPLVVNGFLVDAVVTPVIVSTSESSYMVPAGRLLVITNIYTNRSESPYWDLTIDGSTVYRASMSGQTFALDQPIFAGEGQVISTAAPYTHAIVINGYLR